MGQNYEFSVHNKYHDALERYLTYMIYPVLRSKGYVDKTPTEDIIHPNQSMLVETYLGEDLHPNVLLTHSDTSSFLFVSQIYTCYQNGVIIDLP